MADDAPQLRSIGLVEVILKTGGAVQVTVLVTEFDGQPFVLDMV